MTVYFREHWPAFMLATVLVGYLMMRGSRVWRVVGGALIAEALVVAWLMLVMDFGAGGNLLHPPRLSLRSPGTQTMIWYLLGAAVLVVPIVTAVHLYGVRKPAMDATLVKYDRLALIAATYAAAAAVFGMGGAVVGGFFGVFSGGDGMNQAGGEQGSLAGAFIGAIVGLLVASRARVGGARKGAGRSPTQPGD